MLPEECPLICARARRPGTALACVAQDLDTMGRSRTTHFLRGVNTSAARLTYSRRSAPSRPPESDILLSRARQTLAQVWASI